MRLASLVLVGVLSAGTAVVWPVGDRLAVLRRTFAKGPQWAREPPMFIRFISDQAANSDMRLRSPDRHIQHPWANMGREIRKSATGSWINWGAIGMLGYYAGPRLHIVDPPPLGDPLLARLPAKRPWYPGHFDRELPAGYMESVRNRGNVIPTTPWALVVRVPRPPKTGRFMSSWKTRAQERDRRPGPSRFGVRHGAWSDCRCLRRLAMRTTTIPSSSIARKAGPHTGMSREP